MSELFTGPALAKEIGVSYRQFDYWTRNGWLTPILITGRPNRGTGNQRIYTEEDLKVAGRMAELVRQGLKPAVASAVAQAIDEQGYAYLGSGFTIQPRLEVTP